MADVVDPLDFPEHAEQVDHEPPAAPWGEWRSGRASGYSSIEVSSIVTRMKAPQHGESTSETTSEVLPSTSGPRQQDP